VCEKTSKVAENVNISFDISGSHGGHYEDESVLGYSAV
jgi:hypothetical protein